MNDKGDLKVEIVEGPLKGESRIISKQAASTVGRSSENAICVPDKELSRRHSKIEFDRELNKFVVSDYGSTNGTYIQLVGPYGGRLRLNLNDHILVGRTGFSINRYDFGVSEEIGHRQTMEDSCTIVQHLNMSSLCVRDLSPHSFFGVFDGHGGSEASTYLSQNLHINVADGLMRVADDLLSVLENASIWTDMGAKERDLSISHSPGDAKKSSVDSSQISDISRGGQPLTRNMSSFSLKEKLDCIVMKALKEAFLKTDNDFLTTSNHPQHGSTATIALILGDRPLPYPLRAFAATLRATCHSVDLTIAFFISTAVRAVHLIVLWSAGSHYLCLNSLIFHSLTRRSSAVLSECWRLENITLQVRLYPSPPSSVLIVHVWLHR